MIFQKFVDNIHSILDSHLKKVALYQNKGQLKSNGKILYPNILLVTQCEGFYVAELIGASNNYDGLIIKRHKEKSIYRYFSQFDDSTGSPLINMKGSNIQMRFVNLSHERELHKFKERFPSL